MNQSSLNNKVILNWLSETDINLSTISKKTGISRKTLHNWKNGSKPNSNLMTKLVEYYNTLNSNNSVKVDSKGMIDKDYVIHLQDQHIQTLQKDTIQSNVWESLDYDVEQQIQLKRIGYFPIKVTRTMLGYGGWEIWNQVLGYDKKEIESFFDVDVEYPLFEHPVHKMITDDSNAYLERIAKSVLSTYALLKSIVGEYHIPFHLTYKAKDGRLVPSVANCMIDWSTMLVRAKVKFFN
mgnify:CR=1 FL=1